MEVAFQYQLQNIVWALATIAFIVLGSLGVGVLARRIARARGATPAVQRQAFWGFLFAAPWIIGFVIFVLGPALASLYYSFTDYKLGETPQWSGLDNYRQFLLGEGAYGRRFKQAMFNSFYYAVIGVPLQIGAALLMAMLLNQALRGIKLFRLIFYTPVILAGGPAILLAWRYMLASNGGFINTTLQSSARGFFMFDWLYRGFIFVVESFNGFYSGLSRGDPIGPFKYTLVAILAVLALLAVVGSDWTPAKRERAMRIVEVIGGALAFVLIANGIVAEVLSPLWILVFGAAMMALAALSLRRGQASRARAFAIGTLAVLALALVLVLTQPAAEGVDSSTYLLALAATAVPALLVLFAPTRLRPTSATVGALALALVLLVVVAPAQFGGGKWQLPLRYLTMGTGLEQPGDADYLTDVYPEQTLSVYWFYGLTVVLLVGVTLLGTRRDKLRQGVVYGGLAFFGLLLVGSALDGARYFKAFEDIAVASGGNNFHFALFRTASSIFPDANRVPLWMTSELWSKPALIFITMWSSGASMLIFLAALKGVPAQLYEAAEVDGANRWQRFMKITLPMISPAMFYNVVIGVIAALQTFEAVYILQTPQNVDSLRSAAFFLYERTFRELAIGQGAALSWILAVIIVALTVMQFRYSNWVHYEV